jgi:hypothetical protein
MAVVTRASWLGLALAMLACAQSAELRGQNSAGARSDSARRDELIPPGYGSLRRDDVAITVQVQGLTVRAIPLDEGVIRTLAPDAYNSLHALAASRAAAIDRIRTRMGVASVQAWHVMFFNLQPGDARFDPRGMQIRSAGRDFRPLDVIGLSPGYDEGRLAQSRNVSAIFIFDAAIQLTQPLVVTLAGVQSAAWDAGAPPNDLLQRLERERAAIWSRAGSARKPGTTTGNPPW